MKLMALPRWQFALLSLLLLVALFGLGFLSAGAWLASPADQPHRADAVVVLAMPVVAI